LLQLTIFLALHLLQLKYLGLIWRQLLLCLASQRRYFLGQTGEYALLTALEEFLAGLERGYSGLIFLFELG
jgi:hypothetical protein